MSHTYKTNKKIITRHNKEQTTIVEIDEISESKPNISNTQLNVSKNNKCSNEDEIIKINKKNLDTELENVITNSSELEQKNAKLKSDQKLPTTVQRTISLCRCQKKPKTFKIKVNKPLFYGPRCQNKFIKFVFILLFVILAITGAYGLLVLSTDFLKEFYENRAILLITLSFVVLVAINHVMAGSISGTVARGGFARVMPSNFIFLFIGVLAMSNIVAAVTVLSKNHIVMLCLLVTLIIVAFCVLLANCREFDFTSWYIYMILIVTVSLIILIILSIKMLASRTEFEQLHVILLSVGSLTIVILLIIELQIILAGLTIEIGESDYVLTAYLLYAPVPDFVMQIIRLFCCFEDE